MKVKDALKIALQDNKKHTDRVIINIFNVNKARDKRFVKYVHDTMTDMLLDKPSLCSSILFWREMPTFILSFNCLLEDKTTQLLMTCILHTLNLIIESERNVYATVSKINTVTNEVFTEQIKK